MVSWIVLALLAYIAVAALLVWAARRWRACREFLALIEGGRAKDWQVSVSVTIAMWPFFAAMMAIMAPWMMASWLVIHFLPDDI